MFRTMYATSVSVGIFSLVVGRWHGLFPAIVPHCILNGLLGLCHLSELIAADKATPLTENEVRWHRSSLLLYWGLCVASLFFAVAAAHEYKLTRQAVVAAARAKKDSK